MAGFSTVKIYDVNSLPESCTELDIDGEPYLSIPTMYEGSYGAAVTQTLDDEVVLYTVITEEFPVLTPLRLNWQR